MPNAPEETLRGDGAGSVTEAPYRASTAIVEGHNPETGRQRAYQCVQLGHLKPETTDHHQSRTLASRLVVHLDVVHDNQGHVGILRCKSRRGQ